ncbi:MAG: LytTR family DNA-binding domain-containing protein [Clostridium sp.]|uniref:LytTR family DNA-binding domain-containing protein n=1 Tax=Clostridium sp. LY3-2 TaxID=2942482 RepID=UPI002151FE51|nr:LytTR family DNA-binding domain-containing protein [Clostridium sp. LY3-2]MCR6516157.1 LytTR family transcriptional regulator [Clostridium sp. LY3-2]
MNIKIEVLEKLKDYEIIIRCNEINDEIREINNAIINSISKYHKITFFKENTEYYISLENILFFETEENSINAHTTKDIYKVKYKLYELEDLLPGNFMRVSKSTILNTNKIYSITRSLSSASKVEFLNTYKQVYVSRFYYKPLKIKLQEKRG